MTAIVLAAHYAELSYENYLEVSELIDEKLRYNKLEIIRILGEKKAGKFF